MTTDSNNVPSIRMVIQRYRQASILIEETKVVTVGTKSSSLIDIMANLALSSSPSSQATLGLLAYISFGKTATEDKILQASKTLLNMPIGTLGAWGDGSATKSMLQLLKGKPNTAESPSPLSIILVPQANLIAKITKNGKSIQYRDQIAKEKGQEYYNLFCDTVQTLLVEHERQCRDSTAPQKSSHKSKKPPSSSTLPDPSIPPNELFCRTRGDEYNSFDENGFPITRSDGEPISKSARKRIQKQYDSHMKRHEKYLIQKKDQPEQKKEEQNDKSVQEPSQEKPSIVDLDPSFIQLIRGSFGKRQGLEIQSDMGPFCHVVEL